MAEYRVNLDVYNGPLDLLLYLIRRDELDVYDIPIAHVTEQYIRHVEMLRQVDPNLAGDFLVLAATLMEIKTRMLLPSPPPEEGGEGGLEIDPRAELVRQLLQYKAFKDAAADLRDAAAEQAQRFPRAVPPPEQEDRSAVDLEDVQVWDLLEAFSRMLTSIGQGPGRHEVIYDDTPVELHAVDIMDRLAREGAMTFRKLFEGRLSRAEIVGLFLALLELVRQKKVRVMQDRNFGEILVQVNTAPPEAEAQDQAGPLEAPAATQHADQTPADVPAAMVGTPAADGPAAPSAGLGEYVSEYPAGDVTPPPEEDEEDEGDDDDPGGQAQGTGA